jgi:hypothetical protein
LIDGEGCLRINKNASGFHPHLALIMADREVVAWVAALVGSNCLPINDRTKKAHPRRQWGLWVTGHRCQEFLAIIRPYMRVKHRQADLLLSFPWPAKRTEAHLLRGERERLWRKCSNLNQGLTAGGYRRTGRDTRFGGYDRETTPDINLRVT